MQRDFRHATEQLMAIQQDCILQGIETCLTCDAYETHLRSKPLLFLILPSALAAGPMFVCVGKGSE